MLKLRDYQERAIQIVLEKLGEGDNKQILTLATGLGKTIIFVHLISQLIKKTGKKALILAHREELLEQAKDKILKIDPSLSVGIEMAAQKTEPDNDVILASVATIGRSGSERIKKFKPEDFCLLVIDEAHHASASTYKNVLQHFGILKPTKEELEKHPICDITLTNWNQQCLLLGVTATPQRSDNEGIDKVFDNIVFNYGIIDGIKDGWLSRIKAFRVDTTTSLANVHTRAGDFAQDELSDAINNPERNNLVVKTYLEQFKSKQALVFAVDISHTIALEKAFQDKGVKAIRIDGNTPKELRRQMLRDFEEKNTQVAINCGVLTEGYDNSSIEVVMMARPTKSGVLYQQMIGRGTRLHKDKPHLTIVDFVDNHLRHRLKTSASLLGIDGMIDFKGRDIVDSIPQIEKIRELAPGYNLDRLDFDRLNYVLEEVDLVAGLETPSEIKEATDFSWYRYNEGYRLNIGDQRYFVIKPNLLEKYEAWFEYWDVDTRKKVSEYLGEEENKEWIIQRVDRYVKANYEESLKLVDNSARWRKDRISDAQMIALKRLGVAEAIIAQLNKGKASQLQSKLYAQKRWK